MLSQVLDANFSLQIYHGKQCCHKVWMDSNENQK